MIARVPSEQLHWKPSLNLEKGFFPDSYYRTVGKEREKFNFDIIIKVRTQGGKYKLNLRTPTNPIQI